MAFTATRSDSNMTDSPANTEQMKPTPNRAVTPARGAKAAAEPDFGGGADDALGLYLRQMGAIPLLKKDEERSMAEALDAKRTEFRKAAFGYAWIVERAVEKFEAFQGGKSPIDPMIDVYSEPAMKLSRENILARMKPNIATLKELLDEERQAFAKLLKPESAASSAWQTRRTWRLEKMAKLIVELSPRMELIEGWVKALHKQAKGVVELACRYLSNPAVGADLKRIETEFFLTPEDAHSAVESLPRSREAYLRVRSELAEANLRLVVSIAKAYRNRGLPFSDLIQEGNRGLMRAVDKYEHRLGYKFGTYATWWVRQGVQRALADHARTVRVPCHQIGLIAKIEKKRVEMAAELGRDPTGSELSEFFGMTEDEMNAMRHMNRQPLSIHDPIGGDGDLALEDFLRDHNVVTPGDSVDAKLLRDRICEVLKSLAQREREVIELRYGLFDGNPRTLDEVARHFAITRERIRQIEVRAIMKLRQPLRRDRLEEFSDEAEKQPK